MHVKAEGQLLLSYGKMTYNIRHSLFNTLNTWISKIDEIHVYLCILHIFYDKFYFPTWNRCWDMVNWPKTFARQFNLFRKWLWKIISYWVPIFIMQRTSNPNFIVLVLTAEAWHWLWFSQEMFFYSICTDNWNNLPHVLLMNKEI